MADYANNRELIEQTVRAHGVVKAYDMLRNQVGGRLAADNAAARAEGLTYGQRQAQEWCKAHPLTRKVVPFRAKN